jgi:hypothetical protein
MPVLPADFAEFMLELDGEKFSLKNFEHMRAPLNDDRRRIVLNMARQTAKSTLMAIKMLYTVSMLPNFGALHISPTRENLGQFESEKLKPFMLSEMWRRYCYTKNEEDNKSRKTLRNGSRINLRAVHRGPGRVRGITAGYLEVDELQDVLQESIEVAEAVMTVPDFKQLVMAGTQSHLDSATNYYWENSDQKEYLVRCSHCNSWNELDEHNISKTGLICRPCGGAMDVRVDRCIWHAQNPEHENSGYRFPQIALAKPDWTQIWEVFTGGRTKVLYNEYLALPYDLAGRPISRSEMKAACSGPADFYTPQQMDGSRVWMGIDWGGGAKSSTISCIIRERPNMKTEVLHYKNWSGYASDPHYQLDEIPKLVDEYGVEMLCADFGSDYGMNKELRARIGEPKFTVVQAVTSAQREVMHWNQQSRRWTASRTDSLSDVFTAIKRLEITFPQWEVMQPFAQEILNEYQEYSETQRRLDYNHSPEKPDDALQALNFAFLARGVCVGKYRPGGTIPSSDE